MKKTKFLSFLLIIGCILTSCSKDEEETLISSQPVNEGDYSIAFPFEANDARQTHIEFNYGNTINAVGEGLLYYAKEYFSPSKYYLQEGQLLRKNTLQVGAVFGDKEGLLGYKSNDNPYGLNPQIGMKIPISDSETIVAGRGTIPIVDIFEVNFITDLKKNADIKGIAATIVLNSTIKDEKGVEHKIERKQLRVLGEEAARNLMAYFRELPEVTSDTPIMIALYDNAHADSSLPGTFIEVGYGVENIDDFDEIEENWYIVPSNDLRKVDGQIASQFDAVKSSLHSFLPNNTGIIGKALFRDNRIEELHLEIYAQAKTYTENMALVYYVRDLLDNFSNNDYKINVEVSIDMETFALLKRNSGSDDVDVMIK